jgi:hypothetical protein
MGETIEKINKLSLPSALLIASIILGGFIFATQVNKQRSIERQQQAKIEQEQREYVAKRRLECYEIYEKERKKWNNVESCRYIKNYNYDGTPHGNDDTCEVVYKNPDYDAIVCEQKLEEWEEEGLDDMELLRELISECKYSFSKYY